MRRTAPLLDRMESDATFYRERGDERIANLLSYYVDLGREYRERAEAELLSTAQVAEEYHRHANTIHRARKRGVLPAVRAGREYQYRRRDVVRWLAGKAPLPDAVTDVLPK